MEEFWADFVTVVLKATIAALLPIALYYVRLWLMVCIEAATKDLTAVQLATINWMLQTLVMAAEHSGLRDEALREGVEKKEWVLAQASRWLVQVGFGVDVPSIQQALVLIVERF